MSIPFLPYLWRENWSCNSMPLTQISYSHFTWALAIIDLQPFSWDVRAPFRMVCQPRNPKMTSLTMFRLATCESGMFHMRLDYPISTIRSLRQKTTSRLQFCRRNGKRATRIQWLIAFWLRWPSLCFFSLHFTSRHSTTYTYWFSWIGFPSMGLDTNLILLLRCKNDIKKRFDTFAYYTLGSINFQIESLLQRILESGKRGVPMSIASEAYVCHFHVQG